MSERDYKCIFSYEKRCYMFPGGGMRMIACDGMASKVACPFWRIVDSMEGRKPHTGSIEMV